MLQKIVDGRFAVLNFAGSKTVVGVLIDSGLVPNGAK